MNHQNNGQGGQNGNGTAEQPKFMTIHSVQKGLKAGAGRNLFQTGGRFRGPQTMLRRSPGNAPRRK